MSLCAASAAPATARDPQAAGELTALASTYRSVTVEKLDVLDRAAIKALAAKYRGQPIDILLNNAGVLGDIPAQALGSLDYDEFEEVMAVNVYAPLAMAEAFSDHVAASAHAAFQARPPDVIAALIKVIDGLTPAHSGQAPNSFEGTVLPW